MLLLFPSSLFPSEVSVFNPFFSLSCLLVFHFAFVSNILRAILLSFFPVVMLPLAASIMYSGICFTTPHILLGKSLC